MKTNNAAELMKTMLEKKTWAVIGASPRKDRYGYKIFNALKRNGYEVYPVNPGCDFIGTDKVYATIEDLPKAPDCVDMVVKPELVKRLLESIQKAGIKYVWFQPGTMDDEVIRMAEELGLEAVTRGCVMAELAAMKGGPGK